MNDRAKAIAILRQARDALAERLTERILQGKEEILEDALGLSFSGGIEAIYEELGARLNHVNVMLGTLPPQDDGTVMADTGVPGRMPDGSAATVMDTAIDLYEPHAVEVPALPAPHVVPHLALTAQPVSFRTFATLIQSGDLDSAAVSLAELLGLDVPRARRCCGVFVTHLAEDPNFMSKAMQLRMQLNGGSVNATLMLLYEVFGLQGPESIGALHHLSAQLGEA